MSEQPIMSTATSPSPVLLPGEPFRISLDIYDAMVEKGLLGKRDRVVLLDGFLVKSMTKVALHTLIAGRLEDLLREGLSPEWYVRREDPIALRGGPDGDSEPEPDVAVARGTREDYGRGHPTARDLALIVEVAVSSLAEDRRGIRRYARAGIPSAWLVDPAADLIEVHTNPRRRAEIPDYRTVSVKRPGDQIEVLVEGQVIATVPVADILAPLAPPMP